MNTRDRVRLRSFAALAAVVTAGLLITGCSSGVDEAPGSGGESTAVDTIRFAVPNVDFNTASAYFSTVPEQMGFFEDEKLHVEMTGNAGTSAAVQALLGGRADVTLGSTASMYALGQQDPRLRIFAFVPGNVWRIVVPQGSDIKSYEDLKGKKIGVDKLATGAHLTAVSQLGAVGVNGETEVEWLAIGMGAPAADAIAKGLVDAYASYLGPVGLVENLSGVSMREILGPLDEYKGLSAFVTTTEFVKEHSDVLVRYIRAINQSSIFVNENPAAAVEAHWAARPEQKPTADYDRALSDAVGTVKDRWSIEARGAVEDRSLSVDEAQEAADFFAKYGLMESAVDVKSMISLIDLDSAADFDVDAIVRLAASK